MKAVVGITSLMVIFCFAIKAQDKENASNNGAYLLGRKSWLLQIQRGACSIHINAGLYTMIPLLPSPMPILLMG